MHNAPVYCKWITWDDAMQFWQNLAASVQECNSARVQACKSARVQEACAKCENRVFVPPSVPTQPESKNTAVLKISAKQCHEEHRVEKWSRSCSARLVSHDNGDLHTESERSSTPSSSTPGGSSAQFSVQFSWVRVVFKVCSAADRGWSIAKCKIQHLCIRESDDSATVQLWNSVAVQLGKCASVQVCSTITKDWLNYGLHYKPF